MQMLPDRYFPKRVTYYLTRFHQDQLGDGEEYRVLQPTFAICFLNAVHWPQVPDYHLTFQLLEARHQFPFTADLAVHMLELPKFTKLAEELATPLEVWLYFLRHAETLDTDNLPAALQVPDIQHAMGELTMLTQSDLERERYEARVKWQRDEKSRLTSALEVGRQEGRIEGRVEGRIYLCQRRLGKALTPAEELAAKTPEELEQLALALERELFGS
jgi:predicted transposase/invertase (TIGR01784 family)